MLHKFKKKILYFVYALFALLILFSFYHFVFARRIIPGVVVGKINIGGLTYQQGLEKLQSYEKSVDKIVTVTHTNYKVSISGSDVSLEYDLDATLSRAFEVGRTGNIFIDTKDKLVGLIKPLSLKFFYDFDSTIFNNKLLSVSGELDTLSQDAKFYISGNTLVILPEKTGIAIEKKRLYSEAVYALDNMSFDPIKVTLSIDDPNIYQQNLTDLLGKTKQIVFEPLKIIYGKKEWVLNTQQKLDLIKIVKTASSIDIGLNRENLNAYIDSVGQEINKLPRGDITGLDGTKVTGFKITQAGQELDVRKFTQDMKTKLFSGGGEILVSLVDIDGPTDLSKYGIFALLGTGTSKFAGSIPGRVHNLSLAAERTSGILVPPGGIYSFNKTVGEISGKTGYNTAYIIQNGRTVLGEGGGVCQTSTTLFRAVLNSGLPIIMRYPHAYRVHYYEEDSPVGFDASVFQPSLDFQFKNDTPNYILIQSVVDVANNSLAFQIFGTPDGRTVEISQPVVSNVSAPPVPLYQDDPTLAKGKTIQVDFAAWGANVFFTRIVKRNGVDLYKDTFSSRYQPWRAIYLVGTKS